jgi:two-component system LytT family response regulator
MIRTLIIDDEPDAIQSLKLICKEYCPDVEIVGTAELIDEASKLIDEKDPDLLLLDIDLPRGNAFDLLEKYPKRKFKVILVSALFEEYDKLIKKYGINHCISF